MLMQPIKARELFQHRESDFIGPTNLPAHY
jgi:hypothetical protein